MSCATQQEKLREIGCSVVFATSLFCDYEVSIAPTAWQFAAGHGLQLRLTSYSMPNGLSATLTFDPSSPASSSFVPPLPTTNRVRYGGADATTLRLPISTQQLP